MKKKSLAADSFASLAQQQCHVLGIKQKELSDRLGISQPMVSAYLSGNRLPGWELIVLFACALECSPRALLPEHVPEKYREQLEQRKQSGDSSSSQTVTETVEDQT